MAEAIRIIRAPLKHALRAATRYDDGGRSRAREQALDEALAASGVRRGMLSPVVLPRRDAVDSHGRLRSGASRASLLGERDRKRVDSLSEALRKAEARDGRQRPTSPRLERDAMHHGEPLSRRGKPFLRLEEIRHGRSFKESRAELLTKRDREAVARHDDRRDAVENCKERPSSNRGRGGSRSFIPWCR